MPGEDFFIIKLVEAGCFDADCYKISVIPGVFYEIVDVELLMFFFDDRFEGCPDLPVRMIVVHVQHFDCFF